MNNDDSAVYKSRVFSLDSIEDGIINKEEHIVYVKIDVEGYELNVIRGMIETIRKYMSVIQIEFNSITLSLEDRKEILKTLYRFSYVTFSNKFFNIIEDNKIFFVNSKNYTLVKIYSQSAELSVFHFIE